MPQNNTRYSISLHDIAQLVLVQFCRWHQSSLCTHAYPCAYKQKHNQTEYGLIRLTSSLIVVDSTDSTEEEDAKALFEFLELQVLLCVVLLVNKYWCRDDIISVSDCIMVVTVTASMSFFVTSSIGFTRLSLSVSPAERVSMPLPLSVSRAQYRCKL